MQKSIRTSMERKNNDRTADKRRSIALPEG